MQEDINIFTHESQCFVHGIIPENGFDFASLNLYLLPADPGHSRVYGDNSILMNNKL